MAHFPLGLDVEDNWLEKITGREVATARKWECPKFADGTVAEIISYVDGGEEIWCPNLGQVCKECDFFVPRRNIKELAE